MSQFKLEAEKDFGFVRTKLYAYQEQGDELTSYIKRKIRQPQQQFADMLDNYYAGENINRQALLSKFDEISMPSDHAIPVFDVKRSTVTEFMAEFLLEQEFQCIFFEESNKKINQTVVNANRHSPGIDVVGIQNNNCELKFVVAEVKASQQQRIPCSSANALKQDITSVLNFENKQLYMEITAMCQSLLHNNSATQAHIIEFLVDLISKEDAPKQFIQRIIIFPFLIRNYAPILRQKSLEDYKNFSQLDAKGSDIIGIVWAVNKDIKQFVDDIYS